MLALLTQSDLLAVASRRVLSMQQTGNLLHEIRIAQRMPPMTTGLYTRADAPLTPMAAAMAKLLVEIGRKLPTSTQ